jgi:hypothetical protein
LETPTDRTFDVVFKNTAAAAAVARFKGTIPKIKG